ncbi:Mur ligase family protein [Kiritimatiellaeota bacterium B1221]|nr:Mur ligase family protein [Kiritimatiellaeota bacterium B1221]
MSVPLILLGAGASGLAAARLGAQEGRRGVLVSETPPAKDVLEKIEALGFCWQAGLPEDQDAEVVISPGISIDHLWLKTLRERKQGFLPEFEWAARRLQGTQIAVTGSLGKTSMVLLMADLLRDAGYSVTVSGNVSPPVSEVARLHPRADFHVIELSSFQLEASQGYRPERALCLNLFPNHLDRHRDLENYATAKSRLFAFQETDDLAVWPRAYPVEVQTAARREYAEDVNLPALGNTVFAASALRKNLQGVMALLTGIPGIDAEKQERMVRNFQFPAHRMQRLEIAGAGRVVDDSKSTCLEATRAALEGIPGEVQLVMGGLDKAESLDRLSEIFQRRSPQLYLFGHAAKKMEEAWKDTVDECYVYDTLDVLLPELWKARTDAQTLLFSPGCASFDQFPGYAVRGQTFQKLVSRLAAQNPLS